MSSQLNLFNKEKTSSPDHKKTLSPLAYTARPKTFKEFIGQSHIFKKYTFLKSNLTSSIVLYGPPGSGKTTLAQILAEQSKKEIYQFNAVLGGVNDLKKLINSAIEMNKLHNKESIIFIDEIHRFNKSQQDALLPYIEQGDFLLIGATTESPKRVLNKALLSRVKLIQLFPLSQDDLFLIISNICNSISKSLPEELIRFISDYSNGDSRMAINNLEIIFNLNMDTSDPDFILKAKEIISENSRSYDKNSDRHYDVISAFIKSIRGSDPDTALLWLAVMIDGDEDPLFIARRLVILASEDIGNADPFAIVMASSTMTSIASIGMPESRILLSQLTTYLAIAPKSNRAYVAINKAIDYVKNAPTQSVPLYLTNIPPINEKKYKYPHDYPHSITSQDFSNKKVPQFYIPSENGKEKALLDRLKMIKKLKSEIL